MEFIEVLRQEMVVWGITVKELAHRARVAPNTVSTWFGRGAIPDSMEGIVTDAINSPRLSEVRCSQCEGNAFPTRYLDNVDDHPIVAINKAIEEIEEWGPLGRQVHLVLINKRKSACFTEAEEAILHRFEDETADIITSMKTVLIRLQECYERPVLETMTRHVRKLEQSGYCSVTNTKKKAAPYQQSC